MVRLTLISYAVKSCKIRDKHKYTPYFVAWQYGKNRFRGDTLCDGKEADIVPSWRTAPVLEKEERGGYDMIVDDAS